MTVNKVPIVHTSEQGKRLKQKQASINAMVTALKNDYSSDLIQKFAKENGKTELNINNMNLREIVKPTFGVEIKDGEDIHRGPEYSQKKNDGRITMKEYREKHEKVEIIHRGL